MKTIPILVMLVLSVLGIGVVWNDLKKSTEFIPLISSCKG